MPGNTFGHMLRLTTFGESHGVSLGGILDGVPPGIFLDLEHIQKTLNRRRPGSSSWVSARQESDQLTIFSGCYEGRTLGTPLAFGISNRDVKSADYDPFRHLYRPGHGDYVYDQKYGLRDPRGGGRASARETVIRVAAGAIAHQILASYLEELSIQAAVIQIAKGPRAQTWAKESIHTNPFFSPDPEVISSWERLLSAAIENGRSLGALIEVRINGIPAGLGEPVFDKLDADIAKALMSINAVKGVEIGQGFETDDQGYDEITPEGFLSNRAGGILAGISTGQEIIARLAIKPTSSTRQPRQTINDRGESCQIEIHGRHDPCVGIRAVPIVEAMVALVLTDHWIRWRGQCGVPEPRKIIA